MNAIRGATATVLNNKEDIIESSKILFSRIIEINTLDPKKIVSVVFTTTNDLTEAFPAKAFRELGMTSVAAIDTLAPNINSDLSGCIRILIYLNKDLAEINHVYLDDAKKLRPDR